MKRIATLLLAVLMIAAMIIPASAKAGDAIITLDINTGAMYSSKPPKHTILTRIGENDTIVEVTDYLLVDDAGKDYNYFYVYTVEASGDDYVITAIDTRLGRPDGVKGDTVIPENGFLLCFQAGDEANKAIMDTVKVGNYVELSGVDLNELATLDAGANPLEGAATATIKSTVPDSYIWAKYDGTGDAPGFQIVLGEEELSFFEEGKSYQVFANVWYSEDATGNLYANFYAYETAAAADEGTGNWDYMNSFQDFAKAETAGDNLGKWAEYTSSLTNFSIDTYNKRNDGVDGTGADVGCKGMTLGIGYYNAKGEVRVSSFGIKDADGNVMYEFKFDTAEGLKFVSGMTGDNKGTSWGVEGEKVVTPPTEDAPTTPDVDTPNTGDMTMVFALVAIVAMAGVVVVKKNAR